MHDVYKTFFSTTVCTGCLVLFFYLSEWIFWFLIFLPQQPVTSFTLRQYYAVMPVCNSGASPRSFQVLTLTPCVWLHATSRGPTFSSLSLKNWNSMKRSKTCGWVPVLCLFLYTFWALKNNWKVAIFSTFCPCNYIHWLFSIKLKSLPSDSWFSHRHSLFCSSPQWSLLPRVSALCTFLVKVLTFLEKRFEN